MNLRTLADSGYRITDLNQRGQPLEEIGIGRDFAEHFAGLSPFWALASITTDKPGHSYASRGRCRNSIPVGPVQDLRFCTIHRCKAAPLARYTFPPVTTSNTVAKVGFGSPTCRSLLASTTNRHAGSNSLFSETTAK